jgi:competence protein ComEA
MKKILAALFISLVFSFSTYAAVNLNTANQVQLESINGIGPKKAKAIMDYRKKHGDFKSIGELESVNGIGPETLKNIRKKVTISNQVKENKTKPNNLTKKKTKKKPKRTKKKYDIKITTHQP